MMIPNRDKEREKIVKMTEEDMKVFMAKHYPEYVSINDTPFAKSILEEYQAKVIEAIDKQIQIAEKYRGMDRMNDLQIEGELSGLAHLKKELGLE